MTDIPVDIDRIVREVVRRLHDRAEPVRADGATKPAPATPADGRETAIPDRVVTMESIQGRLSGMRRLVVRPDAVITPSVRDELIGLNIQIVRGEAAAESSPAASGRPGLVVGVAATGFDPADLLAAVSDLAGPIQRLAPAELIPAVDESAKAITAGNALGLLLTSEGAAALCLANRCRSIRAVTGGDRAAVKRAVESTGANLLVIDPASPSRFELTEIVREFLAGGRRECPAAFRNRLGED